MTPDPVFCKEEDDLSTVTGRMKERKIRRPIVVDDNNNPTGTVSLGDIAARAHNDEMAGRVMDVVCGAP
jgi:CBS domain-containing protein